MSTLHQLREGLNQAWDNLSEGWHRLQRRASNAITRFSPGKQDHDVADQTLSQRSSGWGILASELFDDDDKIVVRIEAPGMEKDNFDLQVHNNYLVIRGEKQYERERTQGEYHVTECAYGRFERAIPLPEEVKIDQASASYKKGVLRVELPKARHNQRDNVSVKIK